MWQRLVVHIGCGEMLTLTVQCFGLVEGQFVHPFTRSHEQLTAACAYSAALWHQIARARPTHCLAPACWLCIHMAR